MVNLVRGVRLYALSLGEKAPTQPSLASRRKHLLSRPRLGPISASYGPNETPAATNEFFAEEALSGGAKI